MLLRVINGNQSYGPNLVMAGNLVALCSDIVV